MFVNILPPRDSSSPLSSPGGETAQPTLKTPQADKTAAVAKQVLDATPTFNLEKITQKATDTDETRTNIAAFAMKIAQKTPMKVDEWEFYGDSGCLFLIKGELIFSISFKNPKELKRDQPHIPLHEIRMVVGRNQSQPLNSFEDLKKVLEFIKRIYEVTRQKS